MAYGIGKNSTNLVIIGKVFQATEFMHKYYNKIHLFSFGTFLLVTEDNHSLNQLPYQLLQIMLIRLTLS